MHIWICNEGLLFLFKGQFSQIKLVDQFNLTEDTTICSYSQTRIEIDMQVHWKALDFTRLILFRRFLKALL